MSPFSWKQFLIIMLSILIFNTFYVYLTQQGAQTAEISYSRFRSELAADNIKKISIKGPNIGGEFRAKTKVSKQVQAKVTVLEVSAFSTVMPAIVDPTLMPDLTAHNVEVTAISTESSFLVNALLFVDP